VALKISKTQLRVFFHRQCLEDCCYFVLRGKKYKETVFSTKISEVILNENKICLLNASEESQTQTLGKGQEDSSAL
jgi:hypothetical protein